MQKYKDIRAFLCVALYLVPGRRAPVTVRGLELGKSQVFIEHLEINENAEKQQICLKTTKS